METKKIDNTEDIIDSRDIIARIEELESDRQVWLQGLQELNWDDSADAEELKALKALAEAGSDCGSWGDGAVLIHNAYFETYAEEYAKDVGAISHDDQWPLGCIDWEWAAKQLQTDYTSVDFDGEEYWIGS